MSKTHKKDVKIIPRSIKNNRYLDNININEKNWSQKVFALQESEIIQLTRVFI